MKQIFFIWLIIFANSGLFAQLGWDITRFPGVPLIIGVDANIWASGVSPHNDNTATNRLHQGEKIIGVEAALWGMVNGILSRVAFIRYNDRMYGTLTSNLAPPGGGRFPQSWLTEQGAQRKWIINYYLDVLSSQNRDTFFAYEAPSIDTKIKNAEDSEEKPHWYEYVYANDLESLIFFDAVIIMGGFTRAQFFVTEIEPVSGGYKATMTGDRYFASYASEESEAYWRSVLLPFPPYAERQSFDMIFVPDGDYMDVYLDSLDNHFASFANVDAVFLEELENLASTNAIDLSRLTKWPRRADGSMDYPPPEGATLAFRASHKTTDRLRVRESPDTAAAIVTTLDADTEVQLLETGAAETIGGITAPWMRVLSANSFSGWVFSGYLEGLAPEVPLAAASVPKNPETQSLDSTNAEPENKEAETSSRENNFPVLPLAISGSAAILLVCAVLVIVKKRKK